MSTKNIKLELLYFNECPSWETGLGILKETLNSLDLNQPVQLIRVETLEQAVENKFTGSPMFRINGKELYPTGQSDYALGCRLYNTPEGYQGWPTQEMLKTEILDAIDNP